MNNANDTTIQRTETPQQPAQPQQQGIDIKLLAEKVYQLMLADVRLEQARGSTITRKRR